MSYFCTNIDVAVKTEHDLAIGEILDKASDLHKSVIGAYRCEAGHESNVATLSSSKFSATTLSSCDVYLGIKVEDTHNVHIFDNKKEVADRTILKIESYFGTHCRDCDSPYRNHFQSPTPLSLHVIVVSKAAMIVRL